ncbi:hypothetical protein IE81DRAFT_64478 [Ceraceosorus guamensis]|uniref:Uncharacterized protein n=1 Tax=Ceraceosorus guamensis TaxID=1522189 RepID=A0A316W2B1_9BASI|nr:hypothetical protein IE81DRAFT_64478 [Ceraceosorus guamensis]PWN43664.1 hypothetical protein IE81DRAFT_64478 [Ceraceosorus guamensis]
MLSGTTQRIRLSLQSCHLGSKGACQVYLLSCSVGFACAAMLGSAALEHIQHIHQLMNSFAASPVGEAGVLCICKLSLGRDRRVFKMESWLSSFPSATLAVSTLHLLADVRSSRLGSSSLDVIARGLRACAVLTDLLMCARDGRRGKTVLAAHERCMPALRLAFDIVCRCAGGSKAAIARVSAMRVPNNAYTTSGRHGGHCWVKLFSSIWTVGWTPIKVHSGSYRIDRSTIGLLFLVRGFRQKAMPWQKGKSGDSNDVGQY